MDFRFYVFLLLLLSPTAHAENSFELPCPEAEKLGQLLMISPPPGDLSTLQSFKDDLVKYNVGGVILLGGTLDKIKSASSMAEMTNFLQKDLKTPLFMAIDHEGGKVQRLSTAAGFTKIPPAATIGKAANEELAFELGQAIAEELQAVGFNWNFAPVADLGANHNNPIIAKLRRAFGDDPESVIQMTRNFCEGQESKSLGSCYKHWPGHDSTGEDSHKGFAVSPKTLEELYQSDLLPFIDGINRDVSSVMVGHISTPNVENCEEGPASLSPIMVQAMLRGKLGFEGLIFTDDLAMGAITDYLPAEEAMMRALDAGVDVLLTSDPKSWKGFIESACQVLMTPGERADRLQARINESYDRIQKAKMTHGILNYRPVADPGASVSTSQHQDLVETVLQIAAKNSPAEPPAEPKVKPKAVAPKVAAPQPVAPKAVPQKKFQGMH